MTQMHISVHQKCFICVCLRTVASMLTGFVSSLRLLNFRADLFIVSDLFGDNQHFTSRSGGSGGGTAEQHTNKGYVISTN